MNVRSWLWVIVILLFAGRVKAAGQTLASSAADFALGQKYEGLGEYPVAYNAYKRAGDAGNPEAYLRIAKLYESGKLASGSDHLAAAAPWYRMASNASFSAGQLSESKGDYVSALVSYMRSGDAGNAQALLEIARLYKQGKLGTDTTSSGLASRNYEQAAADMISKQSGQSHASSSGCQNTLIYLSSTIPITGYVPLDNLRKQLLASDMRDVISKIRAQHMPITQAISLATQQADADSGLLPQLEQTIRSSIQSNVADTTMDSIKRRDYSHLSLSDDVLGSAERTYIALDWGQLANSETAKQLRCFAALP